MATNREIRLAELADNPSARVPICLALDTSGSMKGSKIDELNAAVDSFVEAIRSDELASISADIAVVTFGEKIIKQTEFSLIELQRIPKFVACGQTPMGGAVLQCLDMLEQRKRVYSELANDYFQPWFVLMTDGEPTDDTSEAAKRCHALINARKLTVFPIAIGQGANLQKLGEFSTLSPLRMESADLPKFFAWLSASTSKASLSNPGDKSSASLGEAEFKKMSVEWHTAFTGKR
jgi:uncharacterized protein YegL